MCASSVTEYPCPCITLGLREQRVFMGRSNSTKTRVPLNLDQRAKTDSFTSLLIGRMGGAAITNNGIHELRTHCGGLRAGRRVGEDGAL